MGKLFYRIYQKVMYVACFFLPWREPKLLKGENSLMKLPSELLALNLKKPLVVTDKGLISVGLVQPLLDELKKDGISFVVYDKVVPNPTIDNIEEALSLYKESSCDSIISFGGGSPMDCAKAVGARVVKPNKPIPKMKGVLKVMKKLPPLFAIPTTSGTGSETTLAAVVTDSKTHHKYAINDPSLIPYMAVLDPTLTIKLPKHITSTTGMDALCHAVEAYIGKGNTKATKKEAKEAVSLIYEWLYKAYENGDDLIARENMQTASYLAGLAFTRAYVGGVHAIAHTLGGMYQIPHGLANAVIMPYVFKAYGKAAYKRLAELADLVKITSNTDTYEIKAKKFIHSIEELNSKMNIQSSFPEIKEDDIDQMATYAAKEANPLYPVPKILMKDDYKMLIYKIKEGK